MSGTIDKVKQALHLDKSSTTHTTGTHTTGTAGGVHNTHHTTGAGLTGGTTHTTGTAEGVHGPHGRVGNTLDPRVDSDLDGSRNAGAAHNTHHTTGGAIGGRDPYANNHSTKVGDAIDPTTGSGIGSTGNQHGTNLGNSATGHTVTGHTGTTGGISHSTNNGPHNSNLANKADPRVDSDLDGRGNRHGANTGGVFGASGSHATAGSGTAQNTAGPHNSDTLNKLDPTVDSDRDGSKTFGGNRTHV